jgi:acyl-coenzyme A thioesterase PaaI-like protein
LEAGAAHAVRVQVQTIVQERSDQGRLEPMPVDAGLVHSVEAGTPFAATLGAELTEISAEQVSLEVEAPQSLHNHLGGPHAAALYGLAEIAAVGVTLARFGDLVIKVNVVPVVKSAEIKYLRVAKGRLTATATFAGDEDAARASVAERGKASFPCDVVVRDASGTETTHARVEMALRSWE